MTTRSELLDMIANGENSRVEFKRDDELKPESLAKELVAFSNMDGGSLLLGVEDDGTVSGTRKRNLEEWVMSACRDKIRPGIVPAFEAFKNVEDGRDVAVVHARPGYSVHALWHNNSSKYLIRVGSRSREANGEELGRLYRQKGPVKAESIPAMGATVADMDRRRLRDYFGNIRKQEIPDDQDDGGWKMLLENTELISSDGLTFASLLLFGKNPNKFLPQAGIGAVAFQGTEKDYDFRERQSLCGPMTPLLDKTGQIVENGLVEQALGFVHRNTLVSVRSEGGRRVQRPAYPDDVLREGIVNALVHRNYLLSSTDIELSIYIDRIEIVSPGRLPNGITPKRMRTGVRAPRNPLLMNVMRDYNYSESMGMGVLRKIIPGMKEHNGTEPDLVEEDERFTLRLMAAPE